MGNEKIEKAVAALQQETTQEMLAHTLTVIRRQTIGIRLSTYSNFRPFKSSVRPHFCGYSPYTASLHNSQQPIPLQTFPQPIHY